MSVDDDDSDSDISSEDDWNSDSGNYRTKYVHVLGSPVDNTYILWLAKSTFTLTG